MTFEINDKARGARKNITLPSSTSWGDLQDKVAQILNIHPGSLQLQYRFSNEKNNLLPFDLRSHQDYDEMSDQLRPFIVPKILANGKVSKSVRKLVVVQLSNRGTEGVSSASGVKVSSLLQRCFTYQIFIYNTEVRKTSSESGRWRRYQARCSF